MRYIASCSFGKDSLATVILAKEHGEPLDEVVYCEVLFDGETSGEAPEHRGFIRSTAIPKLESLGIRVTVLRSEHTYVERFTTRIRRGPNAGKLWAWPLCGKCCIQRDCKTRPLDRYRRSLGREALYYLGIAADEPRRLARLQPGQVSLLAKYGVTEAGAARLCRDHGLLSPVYDFSGRGGCFFCPNARLSELRHLRACHPDLWARLLTLQRLPDKATERFNRTFTIDELEALFANEDAQLTFWDG